MPAGWSRWRRKLASLDLYIAAAYAAEAVIREIMGRPLVFNVSGAIPAVLLDAGFPLGGLKGVPILARAASLIAHLVEEQIRPIGFLLSEAAESSIAYDGPSACTISNLRRTEN